MVKILICGGGNGAHVMSCVMSSRKDIQVNVLTVYQNEAEEWSSLMKDNDLTVTFKSGGPELDKSIKSRPSLITRDPAIASHDCDVIILVVPSYAHHVFLEVLRPYITDGMVLIGCPGHAGFEYEARHILGDKWDKITIISAESLPWACRTTEYGKSAEVLATKATLTGAIKPATQCVSKIPEPINCFQELLGHAPKVSISSTFLGLTLQSLNACIHPSIMYGYWRNWDGKPLDEKPLFYNGLDQESAEVLSAVSKECVSLAEEIMKRRPDADLHSVEYILDWFLRSYKDQIKDTSSLYSIIKTNKAYDGLCHPCTTTADGKFLPDFRHRYLREDIPYGLVVVKGAAQIAGVKTPAIDDVITWAQASLGQEFLVGDKLCGKDVNQSRAPQVYGITAIEEL